MKLTVVSPHRGDAAFGLGLTIGIWLQQGHAVEVVNCFTRSEFAPYSDVQSLHANDRMSFATAVRKREDESWRKQYGAAKLQLMDLNLKDAPARLHCAREEVFGRAPDTSEKVVSKIRKAIALGKADALLLPMGLSAHVDHVSARDAALLELRDGMRLAFYEELPFALQATSAQTEAIVNELQRVLGVQLRETFVSGATPLTAEAAEQRRRKIALCYDSQIDEAGTAEIAAFGGTRGGRERFWGNAAWSNLHE